MKKLFSLLMVVCMLASAFAPAMNAAVLSEEDQKLYDEYASLVEEGVIADSVSFQMWSDFIKESIELENQMNDEVWFDLVYDSSDASMASVNADYTMKDGDVFVTNGASSLGIVGHAGIVIRIPGQYVILHTAGKGHAPDTITLSAWDREYTKDTSVSWTKVYRYKTSSVAYDAASWAKSTYMNSDVPYEISEDLLSTDGVYCSKLVWQAYYFGPSEPAATYEPATIVGPYALPQYILGLRLNDTRKSGEV